METNTPQSGVAKQRWEGNGFRVQLTTSGTPGQPLRFLVQSLRSASGKQSNFHFGGFRLYAGDSLETAIEEVAKKTGLPIEQIAMDEKSKRVISLVRDAQRAAVGFAADE